ncbi:MAG: helix-turn-helix transcriptional regulator [Candidatus Cloacimonetes bacterium]|nr:helix-turn-helix transcriptional regulator [Candidatus Cloacimonadota bacterium]
MTIKRRLLKAINSLNIKRFEFAKSIDVSNGNLSDWLNVKKTSKPSIAALVRICETYNINMNWLLTGRGSMVIHEESEAELTSNTGKKEKLELL